MDVKLATNTTLDGPIGKPAIDTGRMSARCIFATDGLDRVGDVLNVRGIDTTAHRKNPVVLFDHGKWFGDPIGKSVDPQGNYTVEIGDHAAWQTTYFFPTQLGEQYFALVEMGGLNTNSIGYRPTKKRKNTAGGFFLDEVELVELSWVGVPANGECVRAFLARDKVEGKSIHPLLRAALEAQLPPKTTVVAGGFTMAAIKAHKSLVKAAMAQAKSQSAVANGTGGALVPAPSDEKAEVARQETPAPVEEAPAEEVPAEDTSPKLPLGAEMMRAAHEHLTAWIDHCDEHLSQLENENVSAELLDLCETVYERLGSIEALYASEYPDLEPLPETAKPEEEPAEEDAPADGETAEDKGDDEETEAEEEEPAEEEDAPETEQKNPALLAAAAGGVISGVASGIASRLTSRDKDKSLKSGSKSYSGEIKRLTKAMGGTIKECAEHLTEMSGAENLTKDQRVACKYYGKELGGMIAQPEPETEDKGDDADSLEKAYEALSPEDQKAFEVELAAWVEEQEAGDARERNRATHNARLAAAHARRWR